MSHGFIFMQHGQYWVDEADIVEAGYQCVLGEVIAVAENKELYELAARVSAFRAGVSGAQDWVWWLLPVADETIELLEGGEN